MDMVDVSRQLTDQQTLTAFVAGVLAFVALCHWEARHE